MAELSARVRFASEAKPLPKMWIGFLLGIIFLAVEIIDGVRSLNSERETIFPFSRFAGIAVWLYWLYCVFKFHDAVGRIPGYKHSITPARAVGMHFVPFYWRSGLAPASRRAILPAACRLRRRCRRAWRE